MHLIHVVSSGEWGGPERYAFDICRYYTVRGWDVTVLTRDAKAVDRPFKKAGIAIRHAALRTYPDYYSARKIARLFAGIPQGEGIVHVHSYSDALTCIIARRLSGRKDIRLVMTSHNAERGRDGILRRLIYRGIDRHLFVSQFSKNKFYERWAPGKSPLDEAKTAVTYNSLYNIKEAVATPGGKRPLAAAYRGKLKPGKGLETLIDAFALIKDCKVRLRLMGKGNPDYVDGLRRRAQMAGVADRIDWSRETDFAEDAMEKVHFGVLPSDEPEAFGMANLEFMACGKPQIATLSGAQEELLSPGEDSIAVPPSNPEVLADAILRFAGDEKLRVHMGRKALERYLTHYSWPRFIERLEAIYLK